MSPEVPSTRNVIYGTISALGLAVLSFLAGAAVTEFETFPYPQLLQPPFKALQARYEKATRDYSPKDSIWWQKTDHDKSGVTRHDPERAFEGYTVYETVHSAAYLIDMAGNRKHTWKKPFHEAWPDPPHVSDPVDEKAIHWSGAHVYPNGDVLANYTADGDTPYGYGLIKLDKNSKIIWKYPEHVHHDVTVTDDGTIWTLLQEFRDLSNEPMPAMPDKFRDVRILDDLIVKLTPDGEELTRFSLTDVVVDSELIDHMGNWHRGKKWDFLHTNNVQPVSEKFASHHDFAEPGQLLVSFREINTIGLVDPETEELVWFDRQFWVKQHDPDDLPNGHILIFDNQGYRGHGVGMSRVVEYDPSSGDIVWSYKGTKEDRFITKWGGKQTPLPNGNVLIAENLNSRLFEVDREGNVVWELYNPLRTKEDGDEYIATISGGHQRIPTDELEFLD